MVAYIEYHPVIDLLAWLSKERLRENSRHNLALKFFSKIAVQFCQYLLSKESLTIIQIFLKK